MVLLSRSDATALSEEFHRAEAERDTRASVVLAQYVDLDSEPDRPDAPVPTPDEDDNQSVAAE